MPQSYEKLWNLRFEQLKKYKDEHGHCNVPLRGEDSEMSTLGAWIISQRSFRRKKSLNRERQNKLTKLGLDWNPKRSHRDFWMEQYNRLRTYYKENGTLIVDILKDKRLHYWFANQKQRMKRGELHPDRHRLLKEFQDEAEILSEDAPQLVIYESPISFSEVEQLKTIVQNLTSEPMVIRLFDREVIIRINDDKV